MKKIKNLDTVYAFKANNIFLEKAKMYCNSNNVLLSQLMRDTINHYAKLYDEQQLKKGEN